jgi:hypothetical protein
MSHRPHSSLLAIAALLLLALPQLARADAIGWTEFNAAGGVVASGVIPSLCANPLPQTAVCGPDPFLLTTPDGIFTLKGDDTVTNTAGLFQFLNVRVRATDNTGANGSILIDVNQSYLFSGIATSYTAFDFMSGFFGGPAGAGLPDLNTSVLATLTVDGAVTLPILGANAAQADAAGFVRGPGFAFFGTPPAGGVTFDGQALFTFKSANQVAGDFIDLPFGESDTPEPGTAGLLMFGGLGLGMLAFRRSRAKS